VSEKKSGPENGVVAIKANGAARSAAASVPAKPNGTARAHGGK
jgi:hypothetical protein